jgi:hypothetical protein
MEYKRIRFDYSVESQIITGMVISTRFLQNIVPILRLEYLVSPYAKMVALWCSQFLQSYGEAPKKHIQDIYAGYRRTSPVPEEIELVGEFLTVLSDQYEDLDEVSFNVEYVLDQAENYFKEQALKLLVEQVELNLAGGKILEAHESVATFRVADRLAAIGCEPFTDPLALERALTSDDEGLFTMPGDLGLMLGTFKREFLVAVAAPMKRFKSTSMLDIALQAYYNRLNVVFFSLEMAKNQIIEKAIRAVTGLPREGGTYLFPIWDCVENQDGTCTKRDLTNNPIVHQNTKRGRKQENKKRDYPVDGYQTCTKCEDFKPTSWMKEVVKPGLKVKEAVEYMEEVGKSLNSKFKVVAWPAFSSGLTEIQSCLRTWEHMEGFIPDVIVIDYADILKPYTQFNEERHNLDRTWKGLKALAQTTKTLVVTATQTRRSTLENEGNVGQADIAEDIRKLAHVDSMWGISQSSEEKRWGMARIGMLGARHDDFDIISQCYVLQQLKCGQFCLDSKFKK